MKGEPKINRMAYGCAGALIFIAAICIYCCGQQWLPALLLGIVGVIFIDEAIPR